MQSGTERGGMPCAFEIFGLQRISNADRSKVSATNEAYCLWRKSHVYILGKETLLRCDSTVVQTAVVHESASCGQSSFQLGKHEVPQCSCV
jgi:hypothetical protein